MHLWFLVVLCMTDEPLLNSACLSAFKLIKVCAKTLFFIFFVQQELLGAGSVPRGVGRHQFFYAVFIKLCYLVREPSDLVEIWTAGSS